jgi:pyridoxine kinase
MAILSIQSHVVYGYAGNTAAVFPLMRLGNVVWAINTVEFSNHTGYGSWKGKVLGSELVRELVTGLEERGVLGECQAVLSGYLGDASVGMAVIDAVKKVKSKNTNTLYCCDPVMGDSGRGFYVKPDIPGIFKNELLPLADIVTPNQFELEAITGIKVNNIDNALEAVNILHEKGPSIVLVTSFREKEGKVSMLASIKSKKEIYKISTPELPLGDGVAGTGDMTAAVFLSRYLETKNLKKTLEMCTASVYGILEMSYNKYQYKGENDLCELKIIEAQEELCSPSNFFYANKLKDKNEKRG